MAGPLKRVRFGSGASFLLLLPGRWERQRELYLKILFARRNVASVRLSSSLVLSSTTNQVASTFLNLIKIAQFKELATGLEVKRLDTGDHDHDEQPKKVQRLGYGTLHSACREGDQDLQKQLRFKSSCSSSTKLPRTGTRRYCLDLLKKDFQSQESGGDLHRGGKISLCWRQVHLSFKVFSLNIQTSILLIQSVWVLGAKNTATASKDH